tara:strand:- start:722 stop:943 length:222 start_codon:yes stop_codon:yes gene_type:complete
MAKISQSLSFTFRVGQASNQYCKVNLEVSEIDTELPLDAQLEKVDNTLDVIWQHMRGRIDNQIEEVLKEQESD